MLTDQKNVYPSADDQVALAHLRNLKGSLHSFHSFIHFILFHFISLISLFLLVYSFFPAYSLRLLNGSSCNASHYPSGINKEFLIPILISHSVFAVMSLGDPVALWVT